MSKIMRLTDGSGRFFDGAKAKRWEEGTRWDGRNHISLATGSQWEHEELWKTTGGVFVLCSWSQYQGSAMTVEQIEADRAAVWLSRNEFLEGDAEEAGPEVAAAFASLELA